MATHKPFRELVKPGTNFEFMGRAKVWFTISMLLVAASIGMLFINKSWRGDYMNFSTDFKGGTEIIFGFHEAGTDKPAAIEAGAVRSALRKGGFGTFEVSDFTWEEETSEGTKRAPGILVRARDFGAVPEEQQEKIAEAFVERFKALVPLKVSWSGDRMFIRTEQPIKWEEAQAFLAEQGLELKPWEEGEAERYATSEEGTGEHSAQLAVTGIDAQYRDALQEGLGDGVEVRVVNVYGVGAKAGAKLRNDGITAMFYAIVLIMLYLAFRFDLRYAPGAVIALLHDAIIVIGVMAVTWTEFSLTSVAALLTVIGFSVNDTVVIFDRIRENMIRHKDKKFQRVMNISINETLSRSLLTSITLFAVTLMMNIFGAGLVRNFAFAMNIGVIVGVYSSIFIASPIVLWIHNRFYGGASPAAAGAGRSRRASAAPSDED
jgi:preprotein translocase subunit SecF